MLYLQNSRNVGMNLKTKNKPIRLICIVLLISILFSGCSNSAGNVNNPVTNATNVPGVVALPTVSPAHPVPTPPNGFVVPKEGVRPYAVMVDNQGTNPLPQGGLNKVQIIYEILAEGGITRLMPVFWGVQPEKIGPVRSSRHYFVEYAYEHDAIYTHIGWSPQAREKIQSLGIADINGLYDKVFWKLTSNRYTWQDKYTSYEKLAAFIKQKGYATTTKEKLSFKYKLVMTPLSAKTTSQKLTNATQVRVDYNNQSDNTYKYDSKTKLYMRFRNGVKHMERNSGKQLSAGNIIVQYVYNSAIYDDIKNRQELANVGSGIGWFITCGKAVEIKWSKSSVTSKTVYKFKNGKPIVLNPAQTWIQVVPPNAPITLQ